MNRNRVSPSSITIKVFLLSTILLILITANNPYFHSTLAKSIKAKTDESKSNGSGSDSSLASAVKKNIPSVKLSYQGHTYAMLPFVVVEGQDVRKLNFPQLPDDFQPVVRIPQGEAFTIDFDSKPRETNALVIDYDADITAVSPVNKLGIDKLQCVKRVRTTYT